jgi:vancomycin resistance protein VanW
VTERFRHSFDAFPDSGRVLPFGSGATLFYNYIDLQLRNDTDMTFEIRVWVGETYLHGEIRTDALLPESYGVIERDHRFLLDQASGSHFRENRIYRKVMDRRTGVTVREELVCENRAEMKYPPPEGADIRLFDRDA